MGQFLYSLAAASVIVAVVCILGGKYEKPIGFIGALVLAVLIIAPLRDIAVSDKEITEPEYTEGFESKSCEYWAMSVSRTIEEIYSVKPVSARVTESDDGEIISVEIMIPDKDKLDFEEAQKVLFEVYGFEIIIGEEEDGG